MNLDDLSLFEKFDEQNMLGFIRVLPDQLEQAFAHGLSQPAPVGLPAFRSVLIAGMGGSAISGDLVNALVADSSPYPIRVIRGYDLPPCYSGPETLLIALSHSGNTEETLSVASQALERGCTVLAITTGGKLPAIVGAAGGMVWKYDYASPPRAALGWLYGMVLAAFNQLGLAPGLPPQVAEAVSLMRREAAIYGPESPTVQNSAKRLAGQFMERLPVLWASGLLEPVAQRWKTQINENSKSPAFVDFIPEMNHNGVVGTVFPDRVLSRFMVVQLQSARYDHPRVQVRQQVTEEIALSAGLNHDKVQATGESRLAQQMGLIQYGDYVTFYLAIAYEADPTAIPQIDLLKERLAAV